MGGKRFKGKRREPYSRKDVRGNKGRKTRRGCKDSHGHRYWIRPEEFLCYQGPVSNFYSMKEHGSWEYF